MNFFLKIGQKRQKKVLLFSFSFLNLFLAWHDFFLLDLVVFIYPGAWRDQWLVEELLVVKLLCANFEARIKIYSGFCLMLTSCILKFETRKKIWRYRWCWLMLTSCISVDCSSISADKLHLNLCVWNREVWEPIVVCEVVEFHPHCLVSRYILFVPRICGLPTSSWKGWSLWKMWTWNKLGLTSDNMFNISKVAFWSPMLEVMVVPSEVEVDTVPPHDGQDLLAGGRDATVTAARVAGEVTDDNLPSIVPCLGKLTVQELFLWFGVVDVVIDGDGVHRHKHDRGCLQKFIEKEGHISPVRWHWRNAPNRGSSILAQSRCTPLGTIPRLVCGGRGCQLSCTFKHNLPSFVLPWPTRVDQLCLGGCRRSSTSRWAAHQREIQHRRCRCCPRLRRWSRICYGSRTLPRQWQPPPGQCGQDKGWFVDWPSPFP